MPETAGVIEGDRRRWAGATALVEMDTLLPRVRFEGVRPWVLPVTSNKEVTSIKPGLTETVRAVSSGQVLPTEFPGYRISFYKSE